MNFEVFDAKMSEKKLKNRFGGPGGPPPDLEGLKRIALFYYRNTKNILKRNFDSRNLSNIVDF